MLTLLDPLVEYFEPDDLGLLTSHLLSRVMSEHEQMAASVEKMRAGPEAITAAARCAELVRSHDPELARSLETILRSAGQLLAYRPAAADCYDAEEASEL